MTRLFYEIYYEGKVFTVDSYPKAKQFVQEHPSAVLKTQYKEENYKWFEKFSQKPIDI